jgi:PHD/YefM family antitoxin component YafN of YafNO toxin-antitoxin module
MNRIEFHRRIIRDSDRSSFPATSMTGRPKNWRQPWRRWTERFHSRVALECVQMRTPTEQAKDLVTVGIREFRQRLGAYLLESDAPVAITRHGDTIGYFIPARRKRSVAEREALKQAAARLDALLTAKGVTEDELVADFKRLRASKRGRGPMPR